MKKIPVEYLDGCTLFPDKFGDISHRHICIEHDINYWTKRTLLGKIIGDWQWLVGVNREHKNNTIWWKIVALLFTMLGWVALSTFGWLFWFRRPRWDKN
jgi:hypothetical protein